MTSDELEQLANDQYKTRYKVIQKRFHEGNALASQVELSTLTVLAGIQKSLLEIQSLLERAVTPVHISSIPVDSISPMPPTAIASGIYEAKPSDYTLRNLEQE